MTFQREVANMALQSARSIGLRAAMGGGYMAGSDLLAQSYEIAGGERASVDPLEVTKYGITGALFAAPMGGGMFGHVAGGALGGTMAAAGSDAFTYYTTPADLRTEPNWLADMKHGAQQGLVVGGVFGGLGKLHQMSLPKLDVAPPGEFTFADIGPQGEIRFATMNEGANRLVGFSEIDGVAWREPGNHGNIWGSRETGFYSETWNNPDFEVCAWTAEGEIMGVRHKGWPLHGVQFHPESFLTVEGPKILQNFLNLAPWR